MVEVKQEVTESDGDAWLSYWANPERIIKVEETKTEVDIKPEIKDEFIVKAPKNPITVKEPVVLLKRLPAFLIEKNDSCQSKSKVLRKQGPINILNTSKSRKDAKTNTRIISKDRIVLDKYTTDTFTESLENAPASTVIANQCQYNCTKCNQIFHSKYSILKHFKQTMHVIPFKVNLKDYLKKTVVHECKICSKRILCDKTVIKAHLRSAHNIGLKEYCKSLKIKYLDRKSIFDREFNIVFAKSTSKKQVSKLSGSFCTFKCSKCEYTCKNWKVLTRHIYKSAHGPLLLPMKYLISETFYKCQVCDEILLCDNVIVTSHLQKNKLDNSSYNAMPNLRRPKDLMADYTLRLKSATRHIPTFDPHSESFLKHDLAASQTTGDIGNISFFKCPDCAKTDMSYGNYIFHCKTKHTLKIGSYSLLNVNIVEARYHRCHICSNILLCDNKILSKHLSSRHKSTLNNYTKEYVLKNGCKVYPSFREYKNNISVFDHIKKDDFKSSSKNEGGLILPGMLSSESKESDEK